MPFYLTESDIKAINMGIPLKSGYSVLNSGALSEAANAPGRVMFGMEANPTIAEKAAALVYPIVQSHPFQDANKRTAFLALKKFLELNQRRINPAMEEQVKNLIGRAADEEPIEQEDMAKELRAYLQTWDYKRVKGSRKRPGGYVIVWK